MNRFTLRPIQQDRLQGTGNLFTISETQFKTVAYDGK